MWTLEILVMGVMIAVNGVFAAYEIALASVSLARLEYLSARGKSGAAAAKSMKESMEASLAVVQLGITLVGVIAAATGGAGAEELIEPYLRTFGLTGGWAQFLSIGIVVVPLTTITIIIGELVPKVFALRNKEWVCLRLSPPMRWFSISVWPIVWLFEKSVTTIMNLSEGRIGPTAETEGKTESAAIAELRAVAALARTSRLIGPREENIIVGAARLPGRTVREIMLPAEHISMLPLDASMEQCLVIAHNDMHTRFPVTRTKGDPQGIVGYVNFKDIVASLHLSPRDSSMVNIVRPLHDLDESTEISGCLELLIREHTHIALVRNAARNIVGMITLEDILEELVGDIQDEYDRLPTHMVSTGQSWVVGGGVTLARLQASCAFSPADGSKFKTLSEWVIGRLQRDVQGGDVVEEPNWRVLVRKVRRQRVQEAMLMPWSAKPKPP
ncbi:MAG: hemolysin family protein [Planctomycetota bacterium]